MLDALRERLLRWWGGFVAHHPWAILIASLVLAAVCVVIAATQLGFQSNRNDLIDPDLKWNQRFIRWQQGFPGSYDVIVVVDAGEQAEHAAEARRLIDVLGPALAEIPGTERATWGFDPRLYPRLVRLLPADELKQQLASIDDSQTVLRSDSPKAFVQTVFDGLQSDGEELSDDEAAARIDDLRDMIEAMGDAMLDRDTDIAGRVTYLEQVGGSEGSATPTWQYLVSDAGRFYFIRVSPRLTEGALNPLEDAIAAIRETIDRARGNHPNVPVGLTGIDVIEADETAVVTWDGTWTSIAAFVLIAIVALFAFHSVRTPALLMAALSVAIAISFGYTWLVVGHLQVISVVFAVVLLGLGVDYGIHLVTSFELHRHQYSDDVDGFAQTLKHTLGSAGPGIISGAITTAAAFATTIGTDFTGVSELGMIAAGGVIICVLVMFIVFPAMLRLVKYRHRHIKPVSERYVQLYRERWSMPFVRHPKVTLLVGGVLMVASLSTLTQLRFNYDLLDLLPDNVPSVQWQERIIDAGGMSVWYGISICDDLEQARERAEQFRATKTVAGVGGVGLLFPADDQTTTAILTGEHGPLRALAEGVANADMKPTTADDTGFVAELQKLGGMFALAGSRIPPAMRPSIAKLQQSITTLNAEAAQLPEADRALAEMQLVDAYRLWRQRTSMQITAVLNPAPLLPDDLPQALFESFRGTEGQWALEVYPSVPSDVNSALDPRFLPRFVADIQSVDADVTGVIVQFYESGTLIQKTYEIAGLIALVLVVVLLLIDFRSIHDVFLCLMPVAIGFAITFAIMWLVGMTINPANIIVLPLMFGIGVDAGVHMLHRYRQDPHRQPHGLTDGTGKGITMTSLTTAIGFGVLALASHRGMASLGFVLASGIVFTMVSCWTVLPAWLALRTKLNDRRAAAQSN